MKQETKDVGNTLRDFFKRWPNFYYFVMVVFGPAYFAGLSPKKFLKKYPTAGKIINVGSGPRIIDPIIVNVDITPYKGVDVVASITKMPFEEGSVDRIICDNVLEHVSASEQAVAELRRVLAPDGLLYVATPFVYPFHAAPNDYYRWTENGFRELFKDFDIVELGARSGPFSTIVATLCYFSASIFSFGISRLYWLLVNLFMFVYFPLKYLDVIATRLPFSTHAASVLYVVVRKH